MSKIEHRGQGRDEVVAGTITWEQLRELAGFRAEKGCALSLYVSLDPREVPTPKHVQARVNSLLSEAERRFDERKAGLTHEQRLGLKGDVERIAQWFDDGFDRQGVRGIAVFAASLDNFWSTIPLPDPVPDEVKLEAQLYLAPLARVASRAERVLVGAVGRERGEVFKLDGGRLVEIADETDDVPGQHDQGGWSQARYERHIDEIVERHWRRVAETLDRCVRVLRKPRVVLVGAEDMRSDFEDLLSSGVKAVLIGWAAAEAHADATQILEAVRPVLDRWWTGREAELLDRWREEAARNGRAATGWEQTLEAASDGRVDLLLVQDGIDQPAYQCPACGRAQMTNGSCPLDGTTMESREDGVDVAVHKTLLHGGTVHVILSRRDLEPVGGVGALLRF
jgi:peptide chain release factor subunit 1